MPAGTDPIAIPLDPPAGAHSVEQIPVNAWYDPELELLVDAGYAGSAPWLDGLGPIATVAITHHHPDHDGGLGAVLHRHPGAAVHAPDPNALHVDADPGRLRPGATLCGGRVEILATPGHAALHMSFLDRERNALYSGDLVLGRGTPWVGPPEGDVTAYMHSLEAVLALAPERIYPGHGPICGPDQVRWTYDHRQGRIEQVAAALGREPVGADELVRRIYEEGEGMVLKGPHRMVAMVTMQGYLAYLEQKGAAAAAGGGYRLPNP